MALLLALQAISRIATGLRILSQRGDA